MAGTRAAGAGRSRSSQPRPRIVLVLLTIPGGLVSDVAFASMAGATDLVHGALPYGNLPQGELVHGDTYPLLAYALYVPAALVSPVRGAFDNLDGSLFAAAAFALAGAAALYVIGRRFATLAGPAGWAADGARLADLPAGDDRGLQRLERHRRGGVRRLGRRAARAAGLVGARLAWPAG